MDQISSLSRTLCQLKDTISCPICFDVLLDPISTKCNHHFCSGCFKKLFNSRGSHHCPVCHTSLTRRSCAKNNGSLNQVVHAVNYLIECLNADTGIDLSKEITVPHSSREATCQNEIIEKNINHNRENQTSFKEEEKSHDLPTKSKNVRQYHRKEPSLKIDDSFVFPADFIHPSKGTNIKIKDSAQSVNTKVSSWLTENENDLKKCDDMSILNGSLPKKVPVDLNSSSEEELLSVSQVTSNNTHLAPLKYKTGLEIISEQPEDAKVKTKSPEFKDPYEFISSQKSNQAQTLKKPIKRRSAKSYGNKKKPLGLDISRLVNEPYIKKKKTVMNDTMFEVPVHLDDTFDQLLVGNKRSQFEPVVNKETDSKSPVNTVPEKNAFLSQSDPADESIVLTDFSAGSDDDWAPSKPKKLQKNKRLSNEKAFKPRLSKAKTSRKSAIRRNEDEYEKEMENLSKTFEEVENYKLVTSSQVMREEMARKQGTAVSEESNDKICMASELERKSSVDEGETEVIPSVGESNSKEAEHSLSPGWSRVNSFRKEINSDKITSEKSCKKIKSTVHKNASILFKKPKVVLEDIRESKKNVGVSNTQQKPVEPAENQIQNNVQVKECVAEQMQSPTSSGRKMNVESPETPVRYFNLSQAEERARIMGDVVKSLECSIEEEEEKVLQDISSGESRIRISMPTLPDEDENLVENCINDISARHERNGESWKEFNDLNTPASVSLTCGSKPSENVSNENAKESQIRAGKDGDSYEEIKTPQKKKSSLLSNPTVSTRNAEEHVCKENVLSTIRNDVQSDKKNMPRNPSKGILVIKTIEESMIQNSANANLQNECKERSPDRVERRVHFAEEPREVNQKSPMCSSELNVVFFKAGSCFFSYSRPRVRFLFLGSCVSKAERECEVDQWIIKVSKIPPVCFCGSTSAKSHSSESLREKCLQHDLSLEVAENEEKKRNSQTRINNELNCKSPDSVCKLQVGSSAYEDIQIHSESNVNSITCSVQKLKSQLENDAVLKKKTNNEPAESVQTPPNMMAPNIQISSEKCNKSHVENIQKLSSVQNPSSCDKLDVVTKQMSGDTQTNVNNYCTSSQEILRASGEDVFTSCQNSKMQGSPPQKVLGEFSSDELESEEQDGIKPYQELERKVSNDVAMNSDNNKSELSLQKSSEKQPEDVFITAQSSVDVIQKASCPKDIIKSDNAQQPCNGICSTDDDIFQSNEMNLVLPFQEINSSMGTKESKQENKISNDVSIGFVAQEKKTSFESDGIHLSNKFNSQIITNNQISPNCANVCINSEDVFKTEGNSVIEATTERSKSKISNNFISENLKSNSNHADDIIEEPDFKASVDRSSAIEITPEHSRKQRKRARALIDSSDDSDNDEKVVKKTSVVSDLGNPLKSNFAGSLSSQNAFENAHLKMGTQSIQNSDEDYLLNSEELLQRVIDNINEDLGNSKKPKLRGAKKRILSDSEDDMLVCDVKEQKLSKSPEYDEGVIEINSDHSSDDEDVFNDEVDNDADIVEGTPRKRRSEEESKTREPLEKMNVCRTTPDDDFEKVPQDSTPKKFVLPHSSNLDPKYKNEPGKGSCDGLKKTDHLKEKGMSDSISLLKTKESTEQINSCNSPRKVHLDTVGKSPLRMRLGSSQSNQKNIQKNVTENADKSSVSKDLKAQPRMVFVCSGLTARMLAIVKKFASEIGAGFSDNFTLSMTHLIVSVDENQATPKTLKYLQAVAAKKWVVSFNWITACISSKKLLPEESFEAIDTVGLDGPRRSRLSSESLFKNVQACFIEPFQNITVDKLQEIFMMCGGMVVDSPEGFSIVSKEVLRIIIVDNDTEVNATLCQKWITLNRAVTLNYDWLVDCIGTHTILPLPSSFAVPFTREQVLACGIPEYLLDEDDMEITEMSDISGLPEP